MTFCKFFIYCSRQLFSKSHHTLNILHVCFTNNSKVVVKIIGIDKGRKEISVPFSLEICLFHQFISSFFVWSALLFSSVIFSKDHSVFDQCGQSDIKKISNIL